MAISGVSNWYRPLPYISIVSLCRVVNWNGPSPLVENRPMLAVTAARIAIRGTSQLRVDCFFIVFLLIRSVAKEKKRLPCL
jgi:hypothetical protein